MNNPCSCYYGEDCTKTTVCANESIVEDLEERIAELEDHCDKITKTCLVLEVENSGLRYAAGVVQCEFEKGTWQRRDIDAALATGS